MCILFTWPVVWRTLPSTLRSCGFPWELSALSCTQLSAPRYQCPGIDTGTKYFPEREGSLGKCQRDRWLFEWPQSLANTMRNSPTSFKPKQCQVHGGWAGSWPCGEQRWQQCTEAARAWVGCRNLARYWKWAVSSFVNASSLQCCHFHYPAKRERPSTVAQGLEMPFPKSSF